MIGALSNFAPTDAASAQAGKDLTSQYTTFLNLLTAQIKNQDPLSPMDTTDWTNQLVQYSSVEQQIKANSYLAQIAAGTGDTLTSATDYIGKVVTVDQNIVALSGGSANWNYSLATDATEVTLTIRDVDGNIVWNGPAPEKGSGEHSFTWDGKSASGSNLPDGAYSMTISATDAAGNDVSAGVGIVGTITAAQLVDGQIRLMIGKTPVPLAAILRVSASI